MAEPTYVDNCVSQIRASRLGIDMREPLADGLEGIVDYFSSEGIQIVGTMTGTSLTALPESGYYRLTIQTS